MSDQSKGNKPGVLFLVDIHVENGFTTALCTNLSSILDDNILSSSFILEFSMSEIENADSTQYTEEARTMTWPRPYYMIFSTGNGLLRSNNRAIGKFRIDRDTQCPGKMELGLIKIDTDSKLSVGCNSNPY